MLEDTTKPPEPAKTVVVKIVDEEEVRN